MSIRRGKGVYDALSKTMPMFESSYTFNILVQFDGSAYKIQHFLLNFIKEFKTILCIRKKYNGKVDLLYIKHFFAHDQLKYTHLLSLYISTMQEKEKLHPDIQSELLEGNFCVMKDIAEFTSIALDHRIESEHCTFKVVGEIEVITQKEKALDKFFFIAP